MNFLSDTNPGEVLKQIRNNSPLIWNISNFVSMDIAANALLAFGASPAMAHALEEAESFSQICPTNVSKVFAFSILSFLPSEKVWRTHILSSDS